jgi:hypothetical protein
VIFSSIRPAAQVSYNASRPGPDGWANEPNGMRDRSLIWLALGGIAIWVVVGYPPARETVFQTARHIAREVSAVFK